MDKNSIKVFIKNKRRIFKCIIICIMCLLIIGTIFMVALYSSDTGSMYCDMDLNFFESYSTPEIPAARNGGDHIRVWFENKCDKSVNVTLIRCGIFDKNVKLMFSVGAGENEYKDYYDGKADRYKYKVLVEPTDQTMMDEENIISGNLKLRQM